MYVRSLISTQCRLSRRRHLICVHSITFSPFEMHFEYLCCFVLVSFYRIYNKTTDRKLGKLHFSNSPSKLPKYGLNGLLFINSTFNSVQSTHVLHIVNLAWNRDKLNFFTEFSDIFELWVVEVRFWQWDDVQNFCWLK